MTGGNTKAKMNWLDLFLLAVILLHLVGGYMRGFVKQIFDIFGFFLILLLALWGSRFFAERLAVHINPEDIVPHHELISALGFEAALEKVPLLVAGVLSFLALFLLLNLVFRLFSVGFRWVNRIPVVGLLNRVGGVILGALVGFFFVYIVLAAVSLIPLKLFMEALEASEVAFITGHYVTPAAGELKQRALDFYFTSNN